MFYRRQNKSWLVTKIRQSIGHYLAVSWDFCLPSYHTHVFFFLICHCVLYSSYIVIICCLLQHWLQHWFPKNSVNSIVQWTTTKKTMCVVQQGVGFKTSSILWLRFIQKDALFSESWPKSIPTGADVDELKYCIAGPENSILLRFSWEVKHKHFRSPSNTFI